MTSTITKIDSPQCEAETAPQLFDDWFDPIETEVRDRARQFIEELIRQELDDALARPRYGRRKLAVDEPGVTGHRHGSRTRSLTGTFGPVEIAVPRARLNTPEGKTTEWKSLDERLFPLGFVRLKSILRWLTFHSVLSNANIPMPISRRWECSQDDSLSEPESCRCKASASNHGDQSSGLTENRSPFCFRPEDLVGPPVLDPTPNLFGGSAVFESGPQTRRDVVAFYGLIIYVKQSVRWRISKDYFWHTREAAARFALALSFLRRQYFLNTDLIDQMISSQVSQVGLLLLIR
jgi:hypothetical protein